MDHRSQTAKEAEKYIQYTTKQDPTKNQLQINEQGQIKVDKRTNTTINHVALANNFVKLAAIVPMPTVSRKIIQLRLVNPGITITGICLQTGLRSAEVGLYEQEGVNLIKDYLKKTDLQAAIDKANKTSSIDSDIKNLNKQGKHNSLFDGK